MQIFRSFMLSLVLLAAFSSCKTKNNSDKNKIDKNNEKNKSDMSNSDNNNSESVNNHSKPRLLLVSEIGNISETSEKYTIESAEIKDNILTLSVMFDCGCNPHQFSFVGSEMIAKSLPPIRAAKLILKKVGAQNTKSCNEVSSQIIDVDISNLAYVQEPGNEIYLNIAFANERLLYTFK